LSRRPESDAWHDPGKDDRNGLRRRLRSLRCWRVYRDDDVDIEADEFGGEAGQPLRSCFGESRLDRDALLGTAEVAERLPKCIQQGRWFGGATGENAYPCDLCWLCFGGEWRTEKNEGKTEDGKARHSVHADRG
jgi:hypothetical protein